MGDDALHELTAAYALDALDPADERVYEEHLAHCERCQEELAELSSAAAALAFAAGPASPPAELRERILDAARAERPNVVPLRPRATRVLAAVAAVAAVAVVGLGTWSIVLQHRLDTVDSALTVRPLEGASGFVIVRPNGQAQLAVAKLAPAPAGKTYEAWVIKGGAAAPAGTFAGGGAASVTKLERPVRTGSVVAVTVEPAGGSSQPTTKPFITSAAV
jgi:anti-sigma-K factor RskA